MSLRCPSLRACNQNHPLAREQQLTCVLLLLFARSFRLWWRRASSSRPPRRRRTSTITHSVISRQLCSERCLLSDRCVPHGCCVWCQSGELCRSSLGAPCVTALFGAAAWRGCFVRVSVSVCTTFAKCGCTRISCSLLFDFALASHAHLPALVRSSASMPAGAQCARRAQTWGRSGSTAATACRAQRPCPARAPDPCLRATAPHHSTAHSNGGPRGSQPHRTNIGSRSSNCRCVAWKSRRSPGIANRAHPRFPTES